MSRRFEVRTLLTGLAMGSRPAGTRGRPWFSGWSAQKILAVDLAGSCEVVVRTCQGVAIRWLWRRSGRAHRRRRAELRSLTLVALPVALLATKA